MPTFHFEIVDGCIIEDPHGIELTGRGPGQEGRRGNRQANRH